MSHRFDATLKDLSAQHPRDFLATFDAPTTAKLTPLNVDLSTVTTSADFLIGIGDPLREVVAIDFQSTGAKKKHLDILVYNALLRRYYDVPVHSIIVLLRPEAQHANTNGTVAYAPRPGRGRMDFGYEVVRVWETPAETFLNGPLGTTPLAVLGTFAGQDEAEGIKSVVEKLMGRWVSEATDATVQRLFVSAGVLGGLRLEEDEIRDIFYGVRQMRESTLYTAILHDGEELGMLKQGRSSVKWIGRRRLGPPPPEIVARLEQINDPDRLNRLLAATLDAASWEAVLATE